MKVRIINIVEDTMVDGPGWRSSVYCAGCRHACKGCHNPETWSFEAGQEMSVDEVLAQLAHVEDDHNVTLSGGDPMYQAEAFAELARRLVEEQHRTVWCYTGFLWEQVVADPVMSKMLPWLEVLVDGPFIESEKDLNLLFRGSRNQRLIDVQSSLRQGKVVLKDYDPYPKFD